MFKKSTLASAIVATFLVSACGGGGGVTEQNENVNQQSELPVETSQNISGKAADGYLQGALACLDFNNNSKCDIDEPNAITGVGGVYDFNDLDSSLDLSTVRVIVKVIAGRTIDEDNPEVALEKAYTLTSPPGETDFVSPITTLIDVKMISSPDLSQEEAEDVVKQELGFDSDSEVDLKADYIANQQDDTPDEQQDEQELAQEALKKQENQRLHQIAQTVANMVAVNLEDVQEEVSALEDADVANDAADADKYQNALAAIVNKINDNIEDITTAVDTAIASGETVDAVQVAEQLKAQTAIAVEDFEQAIEESKDRREAEQISFVDILQQEDGIYFLESDHHQYYNDQTKKCIIETDLAYGQFELFTDHESEYSQYQLNAETGTFEQQEQEQEHHPHFSLNEQGDWVQVTDNQPKIISQSDDGNEIIISLPHDGIQKITAKKMVIEGDHLAGVTGGEMAWKHALDGTTETYSTGAEAYLLNSVQVNDHYILPVWDDCQEFDVRAENCNAVQLQGEQNAVINFDELINTAMPTDGQLPEKTFHLFNQFDHSIVVSLVSVGEDDNQEQYAKFFRHENYHCDDGVACNKTELIATTHWKVEQQHGVDMLRFELPSWLQQDRDKGHPFLTVQNGMVRQGLVIEAGRIDHDTLAINPQAMNKLLAVVNPQANRIELEPAACGVFPHQDFSEHDDGNHSDSDENKDDYNADGTYVDENKDDYNADGTYVDENKDDYNADGTYVDESKDDYNADGTVSSVDPSDDYVDTHEAQEPAPVISSDASNSELLAGKQYFTDQKDGPLLVTFHADGKVVALHDKHDDADHHDASVVEDVHSTEHYPDPDQHKGDAEVGQWTLDANGQLLLEFNDDWVLLTVESGLGESTMVILEEHDDVIEEIVLYQTSSATALLPQDGTALTLSSLEEDNCNLDIYFNEVTNSAEGSGYVNASQCQNIANDMGSQFDILWKLDAQGDVNVKAVDDTEKEKIVLRTASYDGETKVIMVFMPEESGTESVNSDENSMSLEAWTVIE